MQFLTEESSRFTYELILMARVLSEAYETSTSENSDTLLQKAFCTMVLVDKNSLVIFHAVSGEMIKLNRTAAFPYSVTDKKTPT